MRERVFDPLGMTRTSMVWRDDAASDIAAGHDAQGRARAQSHRPTPDAAGSMTTTLNDFVKFATAMSARRGLQPATFDAMLSRQIRIHSLRQFPSLATETTDRNDAIGLGYGLGWGVLTTPVGPAFFKEGHDNGFQHYVVFFRESGIGLVLMSNSDNAEGIFGNLLEELIANRYTPLEWEGYGHIPELTRPAR